MVLLTTSAYQYGRYSRCSQQQFCITSFSVLEACTLKVKLIDCDYIGIKKEESPRLESLLLLSHKGRLGDNLCLEIYRSVFRGLFPLNEELSHAGRELGLNFQSL